MQESSDQTVKSPIEKQRLIKKKVKDLTAEMKSRRLVEVPYTASLAHTMNALVANKVRAVPVAAPPGHWLGAGGSMIMESDKQTGVVRKHYIGMVTLFDILAHIGCGEDGGDFHKMVAVPVSSIIGHCLEGLSLWTLHPNTSIVDCMEVFSKGIHRALVPADTRMDNVAGVELIESASKYQIITQMDLLKFVNEVNAVELENIVPRSVKEFGALNENVFAITDRTKLIEGIRCMKNDLLNAVPIVKSSDVIEDDHSKLINGKGRRVIGTLSATDLKGCHLSSLQTWLPLSALDFTNTAVAAVADHPRELVTCFENSPLAEVINKAVNKHVHRIWVIDQQGLLVGTVSLTDIIGAIRKVLVPEHGHHTMCSR